MTKTSAEYTRELRARDPEYFKRWRAAHPKLHANMTEEQKTVQAEATRKWRLANTERYAATQKRYRERNPHAVKLRRYKLTKDEFFAILEKQNYHCVTCPTRISDLGRDTHIDHDHRTGAVRGVLCVRCNHALGHARDSPEILENLAIYLRSFEKRCR